MTDTYELYLKKQCRYCEKDLPKPYLELGVMPLANSYIKAGDQDKSEFTCPLSLVWCAHCGLVQLSHVVPPDLMFRHYLYVSSTTQTFRDHFSSYAESVRKAVGEKTDALAVDIGSNDGLLLASYRKQGMRSVGVDPAENLSAQANAQGLTTLCRYFDEECVKLIIRDHGKADAISANNVFAHIDDIHSVCRNVSNLLADDGIFTIEFPYLGTMHEEMLFDMIYHEHLSYIAVKPLAFVLERFGLEIFKIDYVSSHGGSLRVFIHKRGDARMQEVSVASFLDKEAVGKYSEMDTYQQFAERVMGIKNDFVKEIADLKSQGKRIIGYGAPAKASTLLNFYGLSSGEIDYVVDDNPLKQGYFVPGVKIPIVSSDKLKTDTFDVIVIFAWNFAAEIMKKIGHFKDKGVRYMIPLPVSCPAAVPGSVSRNHFEMNP